MQRIVHLPSSRRNRVLETATPGRPGTPTRTVTHAAVAVIGAVQVQARLRALGFDPGERRLAELEPPQKTKQLNRSGRTLKITTALLVQGACDISKPFGEDGKLAEYLATGATAKLLRRLEADAESLHGPSQRIKGARAAGTSPASRTDTRPDARTAQERADDAAARLRATSRFVREATRAFTQSTRRGESRLRRYIAHASGEIGATARLRAIAFMTFSATRSGV
jgi:hypothetical protein